MIENSQNTGVIRVTTPGLYENRSRDHYIMKHTKVEERGNELWQDIYIELIEDSQNNSVIGVRAPGVYETRIGHHIRTAVEERGNKLRRVKCVELIEDPDNSVIGVTAPELYEKLGLAENQESRERGTL